MGFQEEVLLRMAGFQTSQYKIRGLRWHVASDAQELDSEALASTERSEYSIMSARRSG